MLLALNMADEIKGHHVEESYADGTKSSIDDDPELQLAHNGDEKGLARSVSEDLKLDATGLPLVPQPSRFKDDPLVSVSAFSCNRHACELTNVAELACMAEMGGINPSWLYGLLGTIQCGSRQSQSRIAQ
jgi:hypothetical protein